ncbi:hypothetical protein VNO78_23330 [Psophocarpus tetragonolobus]|uniref:Uncharacterized protein n=1 Tax=Psophocarpus tetragonolobus TaxID=3891 RepID=A0AAN9XDS0_PSOTE
MANPIGFFSFRKPITLVVFDMDGLLLEITLARYNKTFDWNVKAKMMGKRAMEAARIFVEGTGISNSLSAEQFLIEREDICCRRCFRGVS